MKQRKLIYFILGFMSFSGVMVIYSVVKGDLATAIFNLVCLAINVWCLRVVYSSGEEHSDGAWAKILNLRLDMAISRMDTEHSYASQLSKLTGERLSNLEHKYNELKAEREETEKVTCPSCGKTCTPPEELKKYFVGCSDCYNSEWGKFIERMNHKDGI